MLFCITERRFGRRCWGLSDTRSVIPRSTYLSSTPSRLVAKVGSLRRSKK